MSAVWLVARGAVRRRRVQTAVIGLVLFVSAATIVIALSQLAASANPFADAFAAQHGADVVATFDSRTPAAEIAQTTRRAGVTATAGPFAQATVNLTGVTTAQGSFLPSPVTPGPLTVVGRAGPGGSVDDVDLWLGHWVSGPGQIVLDLPSSQHVDAGLLGASVHLSGGPALTVVGVAESVSQSAGAWVAPAQLSALHPDATQVLYRFAGAATAADISTDVAGLTSGLPHGALLAAQSYLTVEQEYTAALGIYVPILLTFGILALAVAVLIVANVISGAVVSGYRHIGILKAIGHTPNQVVAVYLVMIGIPALTGSVLGVAAGSALSVPFAGIAQQGLGSAGSTVSPAADAITLAGLLVVVVLTALGAALRARRVPAARAISAGSAPAAGRALRVQRLLAGTRLPRAVSLGLGLPFARPARTALTVAAVALGVLTITMCAGLTSTALSYGTVAEGHDTVQVTATVGPAGPPGQHPNATLPDTAATQALLESLPGTAHVDASLETSVRLLGSAQSIFVDFVRGGTDLAGPVVSGHWIDGPGQAVVPPGFLAQHDVTVGSRLTLDLGGRPATVTIVGESWAGTDTIEADWSTLNTLAPGRQANFYRVQLTSGTDVNAYVNAVHRADPALNPSPNDKTNAGSDLLATSATLFTVLLAIVAALGVFNTVVLNTRERRRDLGMLKSIGMTPGEATGMMVTSMAGLGVLGTIIGLPLGILAHRLVTEAIVHSSYIIPSASMIDVWHAALVTVLACSGLVIAVLGAFLPARSAARLTIATVLHNE